MKNLLKKVEHKKKEITEIRAVQWDGSDKTLGKYKIFQVPTILAKKLKFNGVLQGKDDYFVELLNKGDYVVIEFFGRDTHIYTLPPKKFNKEFKFVD